MKIWLNQQTILLILFLPFLSVPFVCLRGRKLLDYQIRMNSFFLYIQ